MTCRLKGMIYQHPLKEGSFQRPQFCMVLCSPTQPCHQRLQSLERVEHSQSICRLVFRPQKTSNLKAFSSETNTVLKLRSIPLNSERWWMFYREIGYAILSQGTYVETVIRKACIFSLTFSEEDRKPIGLVDEICLDIH